MRVTLLPLLNHAFALFIGLGLLGCNSGKSSESSNAGAADSAPKSGLALASYFDQIPGSSNFNVICGSTPEARYFESNVTLINMKENKVCQKGLVAGATKFSAFKLKVNYAIMRAAGPEDPIALSDTNECRLTSSNLGSLDQFIVNKIEQKHISDDVLEVTFLEGAFPKGCDKIENPKGTFRLNISELQGSELQKISGGGVITETKLDRKFFTTNFATKFKDSERDSTDVLNVVSCKLPKGAKIYYKGEAKIVNKHKYVTLDGGEQELPSDCPLSQGYLFTEHLQ